MDPSPAPPPLPPLHAEPRGSGSEGSAVSNPDHGHGSRLKLSDSFRGRPSPDASARCYSERSVSGEAKRVRIEHVIKGVNQSDASRRQLQRDFMQLSESFPHMHDAVRFGEDHRAENVWSGPCAPPTDPNGEFGGGGWNRVTLMNSFHSKPDKIQFMADVLKLELSRAVSRSVDHIFQSLPASRNEENVEADDRGLFHGEGAADVQTEALALVVQKPSTSHQDVETPRTHRLLQEGSSFDAVAARPAVGRGWRPQTPVEVAPLLLKKLCLPHVKKNLFIVNEGLTTHHLRKAKLMFFYTRYPSSLVLKTCFQNVQFTRCVASQLIKWFSNFREFYYIQMEKFARHAIMEGVADAGRLTVGRESELFRALNSHYNKANDFQVPVRFLEVAEVTLREFYIAIFTGKDRDPSWKKAIYKVICKLDSDVPADFKSHG